MSAFNVVRFRIKPGRDQAFLDAHQSVANHWPDRTLAHVVKTGERSYCVSGEWRDADSLARAAPRMVATLDSFRDALAGLGQGLGVTNPVSGPVVLSL